MILTFEPVQEEYAKAIEITDGLTARVEKQYFADNFIMAKSNDLNILFERFHIEIERILHNEVHIKFVAI